VIIFDPGGGEPTQWAVCFTQKCATSWLEWIPIGKYKHVRAFGCVPYINTWVFFDPALNRTTITIARGGVASELISEYLHQADVIQMPSLARASLRPRIFGWCVPQVAHLLGLPTSALRPDALWRDCLRQGGAVVANASTIAPTAAAA
jgi:hypothetical protein